MASGVESLRVLLTSSRAPVTLDLARRFHRSGDEVFVCDSLRHGCGAYSSCHDGFHELSRPRQDPATYIDDLQQLVERLKIDLLVPTCEEVFFIAAMRERIGCDVFVDSFERLGEIHNKWTFSQCGSNEHACVPETHRFESRDEMVDAFDDLTEWVFKPVYSRFASETLVGPRRSALKAADFSRGKAWVAQRRIRGQEYSTYSVARNGRLLAMATYQSMYRAGRGSGIYFRAIDHSIITDYVRSFVTSIDFTGQIGFDCIEDDRGVWIIEANPRATSGLHLFRDDQPLADTICGRRDDLLMPIDSKPMMLAAAMPIWGLGKAIRTRQPIKAIVDFANARDVLFRWHDPMPLFALPLTIGELAWIALRERKSLQQAATHDIEWNGEAI